MTAPSSKRIDNRMFDTWARIGLLYKDALDASAYEFVASSTRVVQEQTLRAMLAASQACAQALAQNAARVQQQTLQRLASANQAAGEIMRQAWFASLTG